MRRHPVQRTIRYAVVGAGNIAQAAVLPAFKHAKENSKLVALISSDPKKREELCSMYGIEYAGDYDQFERVLSDAQVDAVYLTVPNHLHRRLTERAASCQVHVLCEKPLSASVHDCEAMIHATRSHDVKLMTAYRLHFEEANLRAIDLVSKGDIGEPRYFTSAFSHDVRAGDIRTRQETAGGALLDLGPYCINAARHIFGAEPIEVAAHQVFGTDERFLNVDEMTSATLRFPGDRIATFTVNQGGANASWYEVVGTTGSLRVDPAFGYHDALAHHLTRNDSAISSRRKSSTSRTAFKLMSSLSRQALKASLTCASLRRFNAPQPRARP